MNPRALVWASVAFALAAPGWGLTQGKKKDEKLPPINPTQAALERTLQGLQAPGVAIATHPNLPFVIAAGDPSGLQIWSRDILLGIRQGSNPGNILKGHEGAVTDLAWNGGPLLASAGLDNRILLWKLADGTKVREIETPFLVRAMEMNRDGKLLAVGGDATRILLFDISSGKQLRELVGHKDWIKCLAFDPAGKLLLSGGYENEAAQWDLASGKLLRRLPAPPSKKPKTPPDPVPITAVAVSPDAKVAALGRANATIDFVNLANGAKIRTLTGHTSVITRLIYHPEGKLLVSASRDGTLRLWNPANGGLYKELKGHDAWVEDVGFIDRGRRLASIGADRTIRIWKLVQ